MLEKSSEDYKIPASFEDALEKDESEECQTAMRFEFNLLKKLDTRGLVRVPTGRGMIQTKWVFDLKIDGEGNLIRHEALLVEKGAL